MKKICFLAIILVCLTASANASSITVTDTILKNTEWNSDTIFILKHIAVDTGITLTIKPGTRVLFGAHCAIWVQGTIVAEGSAADSIYFTALDTSAGWRGIRYHWPDSGNDLSSFSYCDFSYGKADTNSNLGWDDNGGALYFNNFLNGNSQMAYIRNCTFHHNSADGSGGALYCVNRANVRVVDCVFRNNSALSGGAITVNHICKVYIENCEIRNNSAAKNGGGVYIRSNDESKFINCIIADNMAAEGGGAGYIHFYSYPRFYNCTISNNTAGERGGAFYVFEFVKPRFTNTIIWNNSAPEGTQVWVYDPDSRPEFRYCVVEDGKKGIDGNGYAGKFDTVSVDDPEFVNMLKGNFSLSAKSPCVNAGTSVLENGFELPLKDIAGNKRINQGIVDIGALEYTGTVETISRPSVDTKNHKISCSKSGAGCIVIDLSAFTESKPLTNLTVDVFSLAGRLIYTLSRTSVYSHKLELPGLNKYGSGIYFIELGDGRRHLGTLSFKMD